MKYGSPKFGPKSVVKPPVKLIIRAMPGVILPGTGIVASPVFTYTNSLAFKISTTIPTLSAKSIDKGLALIYFAAVAPVA